MSIPEYSFYSTITSSSKNSDTLINTKIGTPNKFKTKIRFDSDSTSNKSLCNNMRRKTTTKTTKIQYYTINDTTESDSTTSKLISTKNSKNSDTSYQLSTNNNSTSPSLNKNNADSRYLTNSIKYIQPVLKSSKNNNSIGKTNISLKDQNHKLRPKKNNTNIFIRISASKNIFAIKYQISNIQQINSNNRKIKYNKQK